MTELIRHFRQATTVVAVASLLTVAACSSSGSDKASTAKTKVSVQLPQGSLIHSGQLTFCADLSTPPLTYYNESQKPAGVEVDLGNALAQGLGLSAKWANTSFNGIIPALQAKQCDAILSQLYIKPARAKVVDFVPYMYASNTLLTDAQHAGSVTDIDSLCGLKAAAETGSTSGDYLNAASGRCTAAGKKPIDIRLFTKDSDALQQLRLNLVDAYGTTLETAAYVMSKQSGTFKLVGDPFGKIQTGIATRKDDTAVHDALTKSLAALHQDGTYDSILKKWNLQADALGAS